MYDGLPLSFSARSTPLVARQRAAGIPARHPQLSNVSLICLFSSSRSVSIRKVGDPGCMRLIFSARKTMELLLPDPCVCQKTPNFPSLSLRFLYASSASFTPRYWWLRAMIFAAGVSKWSNRMKFWNRSNNASRSHIPRSMVSRLTLPASSSLRRFHSLKNS